MAHDAGIPALAELRGPGAALDGLQKQLALLEARVSLLERQLRRVSGPPAATDGAPDEVSYAVDEPGLIICDAYEIERDEHGHRVCWIGGTERLQFVFPHRGRRGQTCRLRIAPHPQVDFRGLRVLVNDEIQPHGMRALGDDMIELRFPVEDVGCPNTNVLLLNVAGVCPAEIGENDDPRLLTARFYGADFSDL